MFIVFVILLAACQSVSDDVKTGEAFSQESDLVWQCEESMNGRTKIATLYQYDRVTGKKGSPYTTISNRCGEFNIFGGPSTQDILIKKRDHGQEIVRSGSGKSFLRYEQLLKGDVVVSYHSYILEANCVVNFPRDVIKNCGDGMVCKQILNINDETDYSSPDESYCVSLTCEETGGKAVIKDNEGVIVYESMENSEPGSCSVDWQYKRVASCDTASGTPIRHRFEEYNPVDIQVQGRIYNYPAEIDDFPISYSYEKCPDETPSCIVGSCFKKCEKHSDCASLSRNDRHTSYYCAKIDSKITNAKVCQPRQNLFRSIFGRGTTS